MIKKVNSFEKFLNESSRMNLPTPGYVESLPEFKEIQKIFPNVRAYGGGSQPLEFGGTRTDYTIKYSRTGSIFYGGYSVGTFSQVDDKSLKFIKDYLVSRTVGISVTSLDSIIEGRTPISSKNLKKDWEKYTPEKFKIFKKGVLERVKDFSNTIKYYQNHPLDKSYQLLPELEKIVKEGFEKSPLKEIKEGELTTEQKNYLKNSIKRKTIDPGLKGKPMYKLNKETGLVDVYGDFDGGWYSSSTEGDKNFMGIRFGRVYGDFIADSTKSLPEMNLSGFPSQVDGYFKLTDNGNIKSLEGIPSLVGDLFIMRGTGITDFSLLNKILENKSEIDLDGNIGLKSLTQIKFPNNLRLLRVSKTSIKSLEGCPPEVDKLEADFTDIEDLKGTLKKSKNISISGPNLKDLTGIFQIEGLKKFRFRTNPENYSIYINLPILNDSRQIEMLISILSNSDYSDRDKKLLIPLLGDTLYDYFEKNPLELYLLDSLPELKKDILQKRNIPDVGKLGDVLNKGFL